MRVWRKTKRRWRFQPARMLLDSTLPSAQLWLKFQELDPCQPACGHTAEPTTTSSSLRLALVCFLRFFGPIYILPTAPFATGTRQGNFIGRIQKLTSQPGTVVAQSRHSTSIIAETKRQGWIQPLVRPAHRGHAIRHWRCASWPHHIRRCSRLHGEFFHQFHSVSWTTPLWGLPPVKARAL